MIFRLLTILFLLISLSVQARPWMLSADLWATPRSASSVSAMPPVRNAINYWQTRTQYQIELLYPGGEEGILWATELKDWLVSLGVPSQKIVVSSGSGIVDQIQIDIGGERFE